jgi:putative redox protein
MPVPYTGGLMKAKITWQEGMAFDAELDGHHIMIDADQEVGGQNRGPKPKGLTLVSLAGCTGMDVISILKKMRLEVEAFEVETEAVLVEEHPRRFKSIVVRYVFKGKNLPPDKLWKAVRLSEDRYCGVSASLKPRVDIRSEINLNGEKLDPAPAAEPD